MLTSDDVNNHRFSITKFQAGYSINQVDDFLDKVVEELRRREGSSVETGSEARCTAQDVRSVQFKHTRWLDGYNQSQVDEFLLKVAETFNEFEKSQ